MSKLYKYFISIFKIIFLCCTLKVGAWNWSLFGNSNMNQFDPLREIFAFKARLLSPNGAWYWDNDCRISCIFLTCIFQQRPTTEFLCLQQQNRDHFCCHGNKKNEIYPGQTSQVISQEQQHFIERTKPHHGANHFIQPAMPGTLNQAENSKLSEKSSHETSVYSSHEKPDRSSQAKSSSSFNENPSDNNSSHVTSQHSRSKDTHVEKFSTNDKEGESLKSTEMQAKNLPISNTSGDKIVVQSSNNNPVDSHSYHNEHQNSKSTDQHVHENQSSHEKEAYSEQVSNKDKVERPQNLAPKQIYKTPEDIQSNTRFSDKKHQSSQEHLTHSSQEDNRHSSYEKPQKSKSRHQYMQPNDSSGEDETHLKRSDKEGDSLKRSHKQSVQNPDNTEFRSSSSHKKSVQSFHKERPQSSHENFAHSSRKKFAQSSHETPTSYSHEHTDESHSSNEQHSKSSYKRTQPNHSGHEKETHQ